MVQVIENLTRISGKILARKTHPSLADYDVVTLQVEHTEPVEGKADLLARRVGDPLEVTVRRALLGTDQTKVRLRCRAKLTPDGAMCEPYPEADDFNITTP